MEDAEDTEEGKEGDFKEVRLVLGETSLEDAEEDKEDDFAGKREAELRRGSSKREPTLIFLLILRRLKNLLLIMRRLKNLVILIAGILNDWSLGAQLRTLALTGGEK